MDILALPMYLMAESLGFVTDIWGDVPFSQAFQGLSQLSPGF
jgi:hypothetical protein